MPVAQKRDDLLVWACERDANRGWQSMT